MRPTQRAHSAACVAARAGRPRVELFGVEVDALTMLESVEATRAMVECGAVHQHVCVNAAKVVELERSPQLRSVIASCDLVSADGQAVVWAARFLGRPLPERVAGIDLFERLLAEAAQEGLPVYFLGARRDVVEQVATRAQQRYPGLRVAGARDGYWSSEEEPGVVAGVAASGAAVLFLAVPSPRKELFLQRYAAELGVPFLMGVGGSFDVLAGRTRRAPSWAQRAGLEWLYRLGQEPRRMLRRYLVGNTAFVLLTLRARKRLGSR